MLKVLDVNLNPDKAKELAGYLHQVYNASVKARANQIDSKYNSWLKNYAGTPKEPVRTRPFNRASNFVPQLIRMHSDILSARLVGFLWAPQPFWRAGFMSDVNIPHEALENVNQAMDFLNRHELNLFTHLDTAVQRVVKGGTCILKGPWSETKYLRVSGGTKEGTLDLSEVKEEGMQLRVIPFQDFFPYPITAERLEDVKVKFHRIHYTEEDLKLKELLWKAPALEAMRRSQIDGKVATPTQTEATDAGINLTRDITKPYCAVEAWLDYPVTNNPIPARIVVLFNPVIEGENSILRAYYNYYPSGRDVFVDLRILPREELFYGYSIPEILEDSQEEQSHIHNARRDSNAIANIPGFKKKRYADVPNPSSEWYPGKVFELEHMDDLETLQFGGRYNDMITEERFLLELAQGYTGVTPPQEGFGAGVTSGRRGIYNTGGTLAMLAEGNRRLDLFIKRLRVPFNRLGGLIYESYREGKPPEFWKQIGPDVAAAFSLPIPTLGYKNLTFDISAAESGANKDVDRTSLLQMANVMSSYYRQVVEATTMLSQLPPESPIGGVLLSVLEGAKDLADRILFSFDIKDRKRLIPDAARILGGGASGQSNGAGAPGSTGTDDMVSPEVLQALSANIASLTSANLT